jgi:hypothetical protein
VTLHVSGAAEVLAQPGPHPLNAEFELGVAVSVTVVPAGTAVEHVLPQLIVVELETEPEPKPCFETLSTGIVPSTNFPS